VPLPAPLQRSPPQLATRHRCRTEGHCRDHQDGDREPAIHSEASGDPSRHTDRGETDGRAPNTTNTNTSYRTSRTPRAAMTLVWATRCVVAIVQPPCAIVRWRIFKRPPQTKLCPIQGEAGVSPSKLRRGYHFLTRALSDTRQINDATPRILSVIAFSARQADGTPLSPEPYATVGPHPRGHEDTRALCALGLSDIPAFTP
jgi:hypothetical protein